MTRAWLRFLAPLAGAGLVLAACGEDATDDSGGGETEFPREETVFSTGAEWGTYSNWNPIQGGGQATYVRGVIYETLFQFDPWEQQLVPWLAESGEWIEDDVYEIRLRDGVTWHDGEQFTADDVKFTLDLREIEAVQYAILDEWLDEVEVVDDLTLRVSFSEARRGEWDNWIFNNHMVPEHLWAELAEQEDDEGVPGGAVVSSNAEDIIVGTGPIMHHSHTEERAVYERYDDWWAAEQLGYEMTPRYIIDFKNDSNDVVLPQLIGGEIDISNNFTTGVNLLPEYGDTIHTYYPEPPHMIPANTAFLLPNHEREPMDDAAFRRALAFSVNVPDIVETVYQNIVAPAHPSGLLETLWSDYFDEGLANQHGFSYDPAEAERILADAGYEDGDGDGYLETPDGDPIELSVIVPNGWSDWEQAAEIIAEGAQEVGINVVADFPDAPEVDDLRDSGEYDLVINNEVGTSNHPAEHYQYLYRLPIRDLQEARDNMQRYEDPEAWDLVQELWDYSLEDPESADRVREIVTELQEISLVEMPAIPMWYNGMWSQVNNTVWTNWPSASPDTPDYFPITWNGSMEYLSFLTFVELEPAG